MLRAGLHIASTVIWSAADRNALAGSSARPHAACRSHRGGRGCQGAREVAVAGAGPGATLMPSLGSASFRTVTQRWRRLRAESSTRRTRGTRTAGVAGPEANRCRAGYGRCHVTGWTGASARTAWTIALARSVLQGSPGGACRPFRVALDCWPGQRGGACLLSCHAGSATAAARARGR